MTAELSPDQAKRLIDAWESDAKQVACEFFRPGMFDVAEGERLCARCRVPRTVHRAYQMLVRARG